MANFNGVNNAIIAAGGEAPVTQFGGRLRVQHETLAYAAQASGSTITVAQLPVGAQILGFETNTDASTSTTTWSVGTAASSALYTALAAQTTANSVVILPLKVAGITTAGVSVPLAAATTIILTTAVGALPASGQLIFDTYYTVD